MGFDMRRFELLVEPRDFYRIGDRVNCILIIEIIGILKTKHILLTTIGEVFANSLLPSFKARNGHIRYYIQAIIDKKLVVDFFHSTTAEFIVRGNSNISSSMHCTPVAANCEKVIRMLGLKFGTVRVSAHLDKNVFNDGETIRISFHLDNRCPQPIRLFSQLRQKSIFFYGYDSLEDQETISQTYSGLTQHSCSCVIFLVIPRNCVSTTHSPLINIDYEIHFFTEISDSFESFGI